MAKKSGTFGSETYAALGMKTSPAPKTSKPKRKKGKGKGK